MLNGTPMRRLGDPDDIAAAVLFLPRLLRAMSPARCWPSTAASGSVYPGSPICELSHGVRLGHPPHPIYARAMETCGNATRPSPLDIGRRCTPRLGRRGGFFSPTANYVDKGWANPSAALTDLADRRPAPTRARPGQAHNHVEGMMVAEGDVVVTEHEEEWVFHTWRVLHPFASVMVFAPTGRSNAGGTTRISATCRAPATVARAHRSGYRSAEK